MIPLYILGILMRFGPQHGYQIKKMLKEQMADFTPIKLPAIYYHLEKMEAAGLITAHREREGVRPEKRVYEVSAKGEEHFHLLLEQTLNIQYRPAFDIDGTLFFSDYVDDLALLEAFDGHIARLKSSLTRIAGHRSEVVPYLPLRMQCAADLIFMHHEMHYQAELAWAEHSVRKLKEVVENDKGENRGDQ